MADADAVREDRRHKELFSAYPSRRRRSSSPS